MCGRWCTRGGFVWLDISNIDRISRRLWFMLLYTAAEALGSWSGSLARHRNKSSFADAGPVFGGFRPLPVVACLGSRRFVAIIPDSG